MANRIRLTKEDLVRELKDTTDHIELMMNEIVQKKKVSFAKHLSVDLRKLFSPTTGNDLLRRIEEGLQIKLSFPDRSEKLPPTTIKVSLNKYRNTMIFALQGRVFTRLKLINLIAGQKGAHVDDSVDKIHYQSEKIMLPLGNLARGGISLEQNARYLVEIAIITLKVVNNQLLTSPISSPNPHPQTHLINSSLPAPNCQRVSG